MRELKECRILVTPRTFGLYDPKLRTELEKKVGEVRYNLRGRPLSSEMVRSQISGVDGYIAGLDQIDASALESADQLKVIARYGSGYDNIDLIKAKEQGIIVTNTPKLNAISVAELTVGLILSLARQIPAAVTIMKQDTWSEITGITLENKVAGILGLGAIGKALAVRLSSFNCELIAHDLVIDPSFAESTGVTYVSLDELAQRSDFLSLHLPLIPDTRGIINSAFLRQMKRGSYLINTARGELVDEMALVNALDNGWLRGAALDVLSRQSHKPENPLIQHPKVLLTPHIGAHTDGAMNAMGWASLIDCLAVLKGEEPENRVV
jgi:D-3-phosphoglycerate dehydrogenase